MKLVASITRFSNYQLKEAGPPLAGQLRGVTLTSHPLFKPSRGPRCTPGSFHPPGIQQLVHTTHSFTLITPHRGEVGGRSPPVHLVLGHVPLRPTVVGGTVGGLPPRWQVMSLPLPHLCTSTVAGESAGSSVAFISSFFSLAMGQPVSQKVPCGTVPRKSLEARKSLVAPYQESPSRHESPL